MRIDPQKSIRFWSTVRVHSWGGLGSQLFALNLVFDTRSRHIKKNFIIIQHTSGFTRRNLDLYFLDLPYIKTKQVNDFALIDRSFESKSRKLYIIKNYIEIYLKKLLNFTRLYIFEDHLNIKNQIRNWTISIRGSYSGMNINVGFLQYLVDKFKSTKAEAEIKPNSLAIHYRLGDLLQLKSKPVVQSSEINSLVLKVLESGRIEYVNIYSDSIVEARNRLDLAFLGAKVNFISCSPFEVLRQCYLADYFIGTGSKISFWILKLRNFESLNKQSFIAGDYFSEKI